jgi:general secretion pathway protein G
MNRLILARKARLHAESGLTLVEIIIVIAILGTLMAILAGSLFGAQDEANVDMTRLQISQVEGGLDIYAAKHGGKYPSTSEGLASVKKYLKGGEIPKDAWGNEFQYFSPGTHGDHPYELISLGKDGQEGGEDVNADITNFDSKSE